MALPDFLVIGAPKAGTTALHVAAEQNDLELALHRQSVTLIKWVAGTLIAQSVGTAALTVALLQLLR